MEAGPRNPESATRDVPGSSDHDGHRPPAVPDLHRTAHGQDALGAAVQDADRSDRDADAPYPRTPDPDTSCTPGTGTGKPDPDEWTAGTQATDLTGSATAADCRPDGSPDPGDEAAAGPEPRRPDGGSRDMLDVLVQDGPADHVAHAGLGAAGLTADRLGSDGLASDGPDEQGPGAEQVAAEVEVELRPRGKFRIWQIAPIVILAGVGSLMFAFPLAFGTGDGGSVIAMLGLLLGCCAAGWGMTVARKVGYTWPGLPAKSSGERADWRFVALYVAIAAAVVALAVWRVARLRS